MSAATNILSSAASSPSPSPVQLKVVEDPQPITARAQPTPSDASLEKARAFYAEKRTEMERKRVRSGRENAPPRTTRAAGYRPSRRPGLLPRLGTDNSASAIISSATIALLKAPGDRKSLRSFRRLSFFLNFLC